MNLAYQVYFIRIPIFVSKEKIIVSTDPYLYIINQNMERLYLRLSITSIVKPIVSGKNLFLITKDNLLVCINLENGKIIYSIDISGEIANFLTRRKKL